MILRNVAGKGSYETAYLPCISIDLRNFPELDKEVGEDIVFVVKGKIRAKRLSGSNDRDCSAEIEIREIGVGKEDKNIKPQDKSLTAKSDIFTESIVRGKPATSQAMGMTILNDADVQLNKLLSK